jgi:hypothetical protein
LAVATAVAVVLAVAAWLAPAPAVVDRLRIVNPTPYNVAVEARADDHGWVLIGVAARNATTTVEQVLDRGDHWTFRFSGQGRAAGSFTAARAELAEASWRLEVPASVGDRLAAAGTPVDP